MKKILIIPHTYSNGGGAERVLNLLIGELSKWYIIDIIERWENDVFVYDLPPNVHKLKSMTYYPQIVKNSGWNTAFWYLHRKFLSLFTILFPKLIYKSYIKGNYDYEISFNYLYSAFLIANSPNKKSKKIMWNHTDLYDLDYRKRHGINKFVSWIKFTVQNSAFSKADKVVSISQNTHQSIINLFPFIKDKTCIIFNGYNFASFKSLSSKFEVKTTERFRLVFVGRLEERKKIETAVRAINRVINNGIADVELLILGDGECGKKAQQESSEHSDNFQFIGFVPNPYPYISSSKALIMTSEAEGFPTVIIEAISLGVPVITTEVGGVKEIIEDGVNGLVVESDINDIAEKICYMKNHYDQFTNHIEDTVKQYTADNWGKNVKNLLESL